MAASGSAQLRAGPMLLSVEHLVVEYGADAYRVQAVSDVSFDLKRGETLGLVGESGCGKSTLARAVLQLLRPTSGKVVFDDADLTRESGQRLRRLRRRMQLVFQDPIASLNPRRRIGEIVGEALVVAGVGNRNEREKRVRDVLRAVGLDPGLVMRRRPHEFSGGQCQRISIARALVLEPELIVCDEPVSALDVSIRAQILNLLEDMKARYGLTLIFKPIWDGLTPITVRLATSAEVQTWCDSRVAEERDGPIEPADYDEWAAYLVPVRSR